MILFTVLLFLQSCVVLYFSKYIVQKTDINNRVDVFIIITASFLLTSCFVVLGNIAIAPVFWLVAMFINKKTNKNKNRIIVAKQILTLFILIIISFVIDLLVATLFKSFLQSINSSSSVLLFIIVFDIIIFSVLVKLIRNIVQKLMSNFIFFGAAVTCLVIMAMLYYFIDTLYLPIHQYFALMGFVFLYFVAMTVVIVFLSKGLQQEQKIKHERERMSELEVYSKNLEVLYQDMRKFRHDYMNVLAAMSGFFDDEDYEGLKEYYYEHIQKFGKNISTRDRSFRGLLKMKVQAVKGILAVKIMKAQELKINVNLEIVEDIDEIAVNIVDFCRCLGILLDNAMEALENHGGTLDIAFIKKNNTVTVVVQNDCEMENVKMFQLFEEGYSTKGDDRGQGLVILKHLLEKASNTILDTRIENGKFIQEIVIEGENV